RTSEFVPRDSLAKMLARRGVTAASGDSFIFTAARASALDGWAIREIVFFAQRPLLYGMDKTSYLNHSLLAPQPGSPSGRNRRKICRLYRERRTHTIPSSWGGAIRLEYIDAPGVALL